jgi:hypothetical protein
MYSLLGYTQPETYDQILYIIHSRPHDDSSTFAVRQ